MARQLADMLQWKKEANKTERKITILQEKLAWEDLKTKKTLCLRQL